jgi:hypothetical protein
MKTVEAALQTYLNTEKNFISCDLFELILANGNTYRYADTDCDIIYNNHTFQHNALLIKRQQIKLQGQVTVDTLGVTIYTDADHTQDQIESQPLMAVAHSGVLDGAKMNLYRAFFRDTEGQLPAASVVGVVALFGGDVEIKSSGGIKLELTIKAKTQGLNKEFPIRKYYPEGCYTTTGGVVISTGETNDTCLIAPFVPRKEVLM